MENKRGWEAIRLSYLHTHTNTKHTHTHTLTRMHPLTAGWSYATLILYPWRPICLLPSGQGKDQPASVSLHFCLSVCQSIRVPVCQSACLCMLQSVRSYFHQPPTEFQNNNCPFGYCLKLNDERCSASTPQKFPFKQVGKQVNDKDLENYHFNKYFRKVWLMTLPETTLLHLQSIFLRILNIHFLQCTFAGRGGLAIRNTGEIPSGPMLGWSNTSPPPPPNGPPSDIAGPNCIQCLKEKCFLKPKVIITD